MSERLPHLNEERLIAAHPIDDARTDAQILEAIDAERLRLDMSVSMPVRVGYRKGRVFAALSRHPDSKHTEGVHMGETLREALVSLHRALAATEPTS